MLKIRFQDREYEFIGDSLNDGGSIAAPGDYERGRCGFAQLQTNGDILRYGKVIGTINDIKIIKEVDYPKTKISAFFNMLFDPSWPWG